MNRDEERELVFDAIGEAWNEFVFYSRKLDKDLPPSKLNQLVVDGIVTKAEIVSHWQKIVESWDVKRW